MRFENLQSVWVHPAWVRADSLYVRLRRGSAVGSRQSAVLKEARLKRSRGGDLAVGDLSHTQHAFPRVLRRHPSSGGVKVNPSRSDRFRQLHGYIPSIHARICVRLSLSLSATWLYNLATTPWVVSDYHWHCHRQLYGYIPSNHVWVGVRLSLSLSATWLYNLATTPWVVSDYHWHCHRQLYGYIPSNHVWVGVRLSLSLTLHCHCRYWPRFNC